MSQAIYYIHTNQQHEDYRQSSHDNVSDNVNRIYDNKNLAYSKYKRTIPEQAIHIPISSTLNKQTLLTSLGIACNFPDYYAHNWDSAWDCLTDSPIEYLSLDLSNARAIDTTVLNTFKSMIEDAYMDFGKPQLWVILADENL